MIHSTALLVAGLVCLTVGAEGLVRGGSRLALNLGFSPLVIGLTLVAFGTSSPELVVSVLAALADRPEIAVGNVVGSNIFNIGVVLGLSALIAPLPVQLSVVRREVPVVIGVTCLLFLFSFGGWVTRWEAAALFIGLLIYTAWVYRNARRERIRPKELGVVDSEGGSLWASVGLAAGGILLLSLGAELFVDAAVTVARRLGISDTVIGLTLVATGTSLPEMATSVVAALRRELDIAIGNVLGSNIFNVLGILGIAAAVRPIRVADHLVRWDIPIALAFGIACFPIMLSARRISRTEGLLLFLGYGGYLLVLWLIATPP